MKYCARIFAKPVGNDEEKKQDSAASVHHPHIIDTQGRSGGVTNL